MKTITLFFAILLIFNTFLFSQTEGGSWILNGGASINSSLDAEKSIAFRINPGATYAVTDGLFVGINAVYGHTSFSDNGNISSFGIEPVIRYYLPAKGERWSWFVTGGYAYNKNKFDFGQFQSDSEAHSFFGGIGHDYFLNSNIGIEGILQFKYDNHETNDIRTLLYDAGLQFFLPATRNADTSGITIGKGAKLIGLMANGGWIDIGGFNDLYISVNPTIGLFINNRLVLGGGLLLAFANDNAILELQPLARFYFGGLNSKIQPFLNAQLGTRFQFADKSSEPGFFNLDANGGIGIDYFLTPNVALEGILQFNGNQIEDETFNNNYLNFNIGFQFFLNE